MQSSNTKHPKEVDEDDRKIGGGQGIMEAIEIRIIRVG